MRHIKEMGKATWYMAKAGLLYGALLGGLFGMGIALLLRLSSSSPAATDTIISVFGFVGLVGAIMGGALGLVMGVVDGPILVLLFHIFNETDVPNRRRRLIQAANALLVTIGVLLTIALVMGVDVVIGIETRHPLAFYSTIALIAGGAFWRATGKFLNKELRVSTSS